MISSNYNLSSVYIVYRTLSRLSALRLRANGPSQIELIVATTTAARMPQIISNKLKLQTYKVNILA